MKPYTTQSAFDTAGVALLKQGEPSLMDQDQDPEYDINCQYRGGGGLKCAIGHLIPDRYYHRDMEGTAASSVCHDTEGLDVLFAGVPAEFLNNLQGVHDCFPPAEWKGELMRLANLWNLSTEAIDEY